MDVTSPDPWHGCNLPCSYVDSPAITYPVVKQQHACKKMRVWLGMLTDGHSYTLSKLDVVFLCCQALR